MEIAQGDVWWADLPEPAGSGPGLTHPVIVVQGDSFNRSRLATVVCVLLTTNLGWALAPGSVSLPAELTGLPRESVANVTQIITIDRQFLRDRAGRLPAQHLGRVLAGIDVMLGR